MLTIIYKIVGWKISLSTIEAAVIVNGKTFILLNSIIMKNMLFYIFFVLLVSSCNNEQNTSGTRNMRMSIDQIPQPKPLSKEFATQKTALVFVCKSDSATRYHYNGNCKGLTRCKSGIESATIIDAEAQGLTLCKYEY